MEKIMMIMERCKKQSQENSKGKLSKWDFMDGIWLIERIKGLGRFNNGQLDFLYSKALRLEKEEWSIICRFAESVRLKHLIDEIDNTLKVEF